ncbi:mitochondrial distribution/morphology family 35/apoptosis [Mycena albidolilacea]|uniref:Mitochondrial distribution/morphology family 35/apoptosis n=1 Tax=Mycena albidolilacea TaxID=1033008 RepID=A0AAD7EUC7_9AGAR|nr:mitochondrial distribution/morphology family 35/apoptosis [Mycena albidolilacea]
MADSLSPQCTPLKNEYDSCFNVWFEEYLEPALATNATQKQRTAHYQRKADEFQAKCGKVYAEYQNCIQNAVKERGIEPLLQQAREEHPLREPLPPAAPPSKDSK